MNDKRYAIVVAGGSGSRMGSSMPKQFLLLQGKPILMHTLERFIALPSSPELLLVLPQNQFSLWERLCREHHFSYPVKVVAGGDSRFQSVKNGLDAIQAEEGLVAIHDGVRPFIHASVINESFEQAAATGNAVVSVPLKDSIRSANGNRSKSEDRSRFRLIQTPQTFRISLIRKAFKASELPSFTDDASVLENMGEEIVLINGSYENIKITTPEDLIIAEAILQNFRYSD